MLAYSRSLVDSLPTKSILSYVEQQKLKKRGKENTQISKSKKTKDHIFDNKSGGYDDIYGNLLSLAINQCPQLFNVVNLLNEEENNSR
jgi:hypothetical protein